MSALQVTLSNNNTFLNSGRTVFRDSNGIPYVVSSYSNRIEINSGCADGHIAVPTSAQISHLEYSKYIGQSFHGFNSLINKAAFSLYVSLGSPTGNIYAEIYAHTGVFGTSGIATGSPLCTSDPVDISILSSTAKWITFNFPTPYQIYSGTDYVVVLKNLNGDASNYLAIGVNNSIGHEGNQVYYQNGWSYLGNDVCFALFSSPVSVGKFIPFLLYSAGTIISGVSAAIDSTDVIHISWMDDAGKASMLKYATFNCLTKTWSSITTVVSDIGEDPDIASIYTAIAVDSNNAPHIIYNGYPKISGTTTYTAMYVNKVGGSWNSSVQVYYSAGAHCRQFDIVVDLDNIPVISMQIGPGGYYASFFTGNANNSTSFTQYATGIAAVDCKTSIVVDANGNHYIAFARNTADLEVFKHAYGAAWSSWTDLNPTNSGVYGLSLAIAGTDIYAFTDNITTISYMIWDGSTWSDEITLETGSYNSLIAKCGFWVDNDSEGAIKIRDAGVLAPISLGYTLSTRYKIGNSLILAENLSLDNVYVKLRKYNSPTDGVVLKIYSGGGKNTLVATSNTIPASSITTVEQNLRAEFSSTVNLVADTTYYFVVERTGSIDGTNYYGLSVILSADILSIGWNAVYIYQNGAWEASSFYDGWGVYIERTPKELDYVFIDETATPDVWWDTLQLSSPAVWAAKPLKYHNGSSWVAGVLKYHNGSSWVAKDLKIQS